MSRRRWADRVWAVVVTLGFVMFLGFPLLLGTVIEWDHRSLQAAVSTPVETVRTPYGHLPDRAALSDPLSVQAPDKWKGIKRLLRYLPKRAAPAVADEPAPNVVVTQVRTAATPGAWRENAARTPSASRATAAAKPRKRRVPLCECHC